MKNVVRFLGNTVLGLVVLAAASVTATEGVSPGAIDRMSQVNNACPTFSWGMDSDTVAFDIVAYLLPDDASKQAELTAETEALFTRVSGNATSWTPSADQCLAPGGRYVWFVRTVDELAGDEAVAASEWSAGRYFMVAAAPSVDDVARALEVLQRYVAQGGDAQVLASTVIGSSTEAPSAPVKGAGTSGPKSVTTASAAIRGANPEYDVEAYGIVGVTNSVYGAGVAAANTEGGPDLLLDGSFDGGTNTSLYEWGLDRSSPNDETFWVRNIGGGTMTLDVFGTLRGTALECPGCVDTTDLADESVGSAQIEYGGVGTDNIDFSAVTSSRIADGTIVSADLADESVTSAKIEVGAVQTAHFDSGAVNSAAILDGTIRSGDLGDGIVTGAKILNGTITAADMAPESVGSSAIEDGGIATADIDAGAVGTAQLADAAVTAAKLAPGAIGAGSLADDSVTSATIANGTIVAIDLADGIVTSAKLANGAVQNAKLGPGAVTTDKLGDSAVSNAKLAMNSVTASRILDGSIVGADLADGAVSGSKLGLNSVTGAHIVDESVGSADLAPDSVTVSKIAEEAVTTLHIENGTITADDVDPTGGIYASKSSLYIVEEVGAIGGYATAGLSAACADENDLPIGNGCSTDNASNAIQLKVSGVLYWDSETEPAVAGCVWYSNESSPVTVIASIVCVSVPGP